MSTDKKVKELMVLADIREALGVGHKPMLSELVEIIRELARDKARLDWLERNKAEIIRSFFPHEQVAVAKYGHFNYGWHYDTREAIDAAMEEEASSG